jgi:hypothetical protein
MAARNEAKIRFTAETTQFNEQIRQASQSMTELLSEMKLSQAQFKGNEQSVDALTDKKRILTQQLDASANKVEALEQKLQKAKDIYGDNSTEVSKLKTQLNNAQRQYVTTESAIEDVNKALNDQEKESEQAADATEELDTAVDNAGDGFTVFKGIVANLASTAITAAVSAIRDLATGLWGLADETRELRTEMGKLDAAFTASGHSSETAAATYETLYGVIGETDQSVEAAQQIALLSNNTRDAAQWAELAAGVVGRFGDALQPETFFEAANETLKLGEATGAYTQMLEGTGMNVEKFNAGLAAASTAEEKQAYMLSVTNQALGAAGEAYRQNNAQIIEANTAQSQYNNALAGLGSIVEPVKTVVVSGMAEMLKSVNSFLTGGISAKEMFSQLKSTVTESIQGIKAALPQMGQVGVELISTLAQGIVTGLPKLLSSATNIVVSIATGISNNAQKILAMGGQLITSLGQGIVSAVPRLITSAAQIIGSLASGITANAQTFLSKGLDLLNGLADSLTRSAPLLVKNGVAFIRNLVQGLMNSLPELISRVPEIISKFANVINQNAPTIIAGGVGIIKDLIVGIIKAIPTLIKNIPKIITAIVDVWEAFNWANLGKKAITLLKDGIIKAAGLVKTAGAKVLTTITTALKNLPTNLLNLGKSGITGLANGIKGLAGSVKSAAISIFNAVIDSVKNLPSRLLSIGKDLVRGLWNGISDMTGWVIGKIQGFGESVLGGIKRFFGINSPSRLMADAIGLPLAQGIGVGIEDNEDEALKPMQGIVDKVKGINLAGAWDKIAGASGKLNYDVSAQLGDYVSSAIDSTSPYALLGTLIDAVEDLASRAIVLDIDGVRFATATAGASDSVSGNRLNLRSRGVALK